MKREALVRLIAKDAITRKHGNLVLKWSEAAWITTVVTHVCIFNALPPPEQESIIERYTS